MVAARRAAALLCAATVGLAAGPLRSRPAFAADPPGPTPAQKPSTPSSRDALRACAAGDAARGAALLADLYAETKDPGHVFNQGRCYQQNGQVEPALQRFREYLRIGAKDEPPADLARARGYVAELEGIMAARRVEAERQLAAGAAAARARDTKRVRTLRITSLVLGGMSVAALSTGAFLSTRVRALESEIEGRFVGQQVVPDSGPLKRQLADGGRYETWQWISYGVGVAALAGAATTFALAGFSWNVSPEAPHAGAPAVSLAPVVTPDALGGVLRGQF